MTCAVSLCPQTSISSEGAGGSKTYSPSYSRPKLRQPLPLSMLQTQDMEEYCEIISYKVLPNMESCMTLLASFFLPLIFVSH